MYPEASLLAHPLPNDGPPSSIFILHMLPEMLPGGPFAILTNIDDIFFSIYAFQPEYLVKNLEKFLNIKVLRLDYVPGLETMVGNMFQQIAVNPPPAQEEVDCDGTTPLYRSRFTLNSFPLLEEIVFYARTPDTRQSPIDEKGRAHERASALESFGPFVTARHQMGRPVRVSWSTDGVPRYFMREVEI